MRTKHIQTCVRNTFILIRWHENAAALVLSSHGGGVYSCVYCGDGSEVRDRAASRSRRSLLRRLRLPLGSSVTPSPAAAAAPALSRDTRGAFATARSSGANRRILRVMVPISHGRLGYQVQGISAMSRLCRVPSGRMRAVVHTTCRYYCGSSKYRLVYQVHCVSVMPWLPRVLNATVPTTWADRLHD
jgi:hypothetical protein